MINAPQVLIAQYQIRLLQKGTVPENPHPFVPPQLFPGGKELDPLNVSGESEL